MSKTNTQGSFCKSLCWLLGMGGGGYLTYYLIYELGQERVQSGVIGIVAMLIIGLILRRLFCRKAVKPDHIVASPSKEALSKVVEKPAKPASPVRGAEGLRAATAKTVQKPAVMKPTEKAADKLDLQLEDKVMAAASAIGATVGPKVVKPVVETVIEADDSDADSDADENFDWDEDEEAEFEALIQEEEAAPVVVAAPSPPAKVAEMPQAKPVVPASNPVPAKPVEKAPVRVETVAPPTPKPIVAAPVPKPSDDDVQEIKPLEPKGLDAPDGAADDLTKIEGIHADLQAALNKAGIYHYSQFVNMNRRELAWLDQNLPNEEGQGAAENWRKQAIQLSRQTG